MGWFEYIVNPGKIIGDVIKKVGGDNPVTNIISGIADPVSTVYNAVKSKPEPEPAAPPAPPTPNNAETQKEMSDAARKARKVKGRAANYLTGSSGSGFLGSSGSLFQPILGA